MWGLSMPVEARSIDELEKFIKGKKVLECRVKRLGDIIKVKVRTKKYLYTLKVDSNEKLDEVLKRLGVDNVIEV